MKAGKVWGSTECIEINPFTELHRIVVRAGGYCSKHKHNHKWNGFYVESGALEVRIWQDSYDLVDNTVLRSGDYTKVTPGLYHQFVALEPTVAFEIYWAQKPEVDIIRETVGGKDVSVNCGGDHAARGHAGHRIRPD